MSLRSVLSGVGVALALGATLAAQAAQQTLGTVRIPQQVTANGQPLPAGTYTVRLSSETVPPVVGQAPEATHWVEFVQGGQVRGREMASVVPAAEVQAIAEMTPPGPGTSKVQMLKGSEYIRVWVNRGGTHYLVHLTTGAGATK
jgi:hypothetical protein